MRKSKQFILLLLVTTAFYACQKDNTTETADLTGYAYLYDVNGVRQTDNSGISINIEGSSVSVTTGTDGKWSMHGLNIGNYTFAISKPNFNTVKCQGFKFSGNGQSFGSTSLFQIPSYSIINLSDTTIKGNVNIHIYGTFTGTLPSVYSYHLYFGLNSNVSSNFPDYFYSTIISGNTQQVNFKTIVDINSFPYPNYQYSSLVGDTLYMVAYADNPASISYYVNNNNNGYYVYPSLNQTPSNIVKVIVR